MPNGWNRNLDEWEKALEETERAMEKIEAGLLGGGEGVAVFENDKEAVVQALDALSAASIIPITASLFDASDVSIPGENCDGMDYIPIGEVAGVTKDADSAAVRK